jgi:hypothetical protein
MFLQLSRVVNFHKVIGDPTRIRILTLLAKGPLHGQAIAGKLGLTAPTITHHMAKLREINVVKERREKNTIYFYLNESAFRHQAEAILHLVFGKEDKMTDQSTKKTRQEIVDNFLTRDGRLKNIPAQRKKKIIILEYLVKGLEMGKKYTEKEINEYIKKFHDDYATIRRELIIHQFMYRENGIYELNPPELWSKID